MRISKFSRRRVPKAKVPISIDLPKAGSSQCDFAGYITFESRKIATRQQISRQDFYTVNVASIYDDFAKFSCLVLCHGPDGSRSIRASVSIGLGRYSSRYAYAAGRMPEGPVSQAKSGRSGARTTPWLCDESSGSVEKALMSNIHEGVMRGQEHCLDAFKRT